MVLPEQIIASFDEILDYVYGRRYGRDNPHKSDEQTAHKWIEEGITLAIATAVFYHRMSQMHERFLRQPDDRDRSNIPGSLKVFDENIESAIRRVKNEGQADPWESIDARWRARIGSFLKTSLWHPDLWGPSPDEFGFRGPSRLLTEMRDRAEEKKNAN